MQDVGAIFVAFVIAAVPLAIGVQKALQVVRDLVNPSGSWPSWLWVAAAFVAGVLLCVGWQLNLASTLEHGIPALAGDTHLDGVAGQVLTGLGIGAMAGVWHDKLAVWSSREAANNAQT